MSVTGLSSLLLRWQESRDGGRVLPAEELCAGRPELADELRRRIHALESMERRLGMVPAADFPAVPGFDILDVLDQGGMGVVYRARRKDGEGEVALKMIRTGDLAGPEQRARFRAEAEAVARLRHPNIVQIFEVGEAEGLPFFSMELVEGGSLAGRLADGPLDPRDAAALVEKLAGAVEFAHQHGIIHRDLKPANILLSAESRVPSPESIGSGLGTRHSILSEALSTPKIADFGLARRLDAATRHTQSGAILGTPGYMAPEQAGGRAKDVGPAADVYALGALLYECLTGRPPFKGETFLEAVLQVLHTEPAPPATVRPGLPRELETICLKCLAKEPGARYASAAALADDLRRFLDGRPIRARRASAWGRAARWLGRRPALLILVLAASIGVGIAASAEFRAREAARRRAVEVAPQARQILRKYCYECHGLDPATTERRLNVLDHTLLVDGGRKLVVPGAPNDSRLIQRLVDESMPPPRAEELPRVAPEEMQVLKDWIAGGAPAFPAEEGPIPTPPGPTTLSTRAKQIFQEQCYTCHRFDNACGGIKLLNHDLLVAKRKVVIPGRPDESELYLLLEGKAEPVMPPRGQARMKGEDLDVIRRWIAEGAPPFPRSR